MITVDLPTIAKFLYIVGGVVCAALVALVGFAWRAGGDVREIRLFIENHGPRLNKVEETVIDLHTRVTVLESAK
jgi:hypothetical protein